MPPETAAAAASYIVVVAAAVAVVVAVVVAAATGCVWRRHIVSLVCRKWASQCHDYGSRGGLLQGYSRPLITPSNK